jgi:hypothetical protein
MQTISNVTEASLALGKIAKQLLTAVNAQNYDYSPWIIFNGDNVHWAYTKNKLIAARAIISLEKREDYLKQFTEVALFADGHPNPFNITDFMRGLLS